MFMLLNISFSVSSQIRFDADMTESIGHFRAMPLFLSDDQVQPFTRHSIQDKEGYLWTSGGRGVLRYNGYDFEEANFSNDNVKNELGRPFLFVDNAKELWIGSSHLFLYNYQTRLFTSFRVSNRGRINSIVEDKDGYLWIAGSEFGFLKYDKSLHQVVSGEATELYSNAPQDVVNLVYDESKNTIWMAATNGLYGFDIYQQRLFKVKTDIDQYFNNFPIRDIAIDQNRNLLWVGTPMGLLRIDTNTLKTKRFVTSEKPNSLPINDVNSTFLDSGGNLWLGLEKEGVCVFRYSTEDFNCLRSSLDGKNKLPFATVEDINEDDNGSIWLSMNNYGMYRITPDLEKFENLDNRFTNNVQSYFPNSFDGVLRENNDLWISTDGGGINIYNTQSGIFQNLKQIANDPNSLSSNSVISLTQDESGDIWAGTWAGGMSRIDPDSLQVERFLHEPDKPVNNTIMGNNIFVVKSDKQGGIWLSVWGRGLQYYNTKDKRFTNFPHDARGTTTTIYNSEISHLQLFDNKVWITGESGLEVLDISTQEFTYLLPAKQYEFNFVEVLSYEEIWVGTANGFFKFNSITGESIHYTTKNGLSDNAVTYLKKDANGKLWLATGNGVSVFDPTTEQFSNYFERDGLIGNRMGDHGEFMFVEDTLYIPGKFGVTLVKPNNMPKNSLRPKTTISSIEFINTTKFSKAYEDDTSKILDFSGISIPHNSNSLQFDFIALSFIFPNYNKYKYRLQGWQSEFVETTANERVARFTNLPAGKYRFEVYSSNSSGVWDEQGDSFSFTILVPWWKTWWGILIFAALLLSSIWLTMRWRLALNIQREKQLQIKVKEKTVQLASYTSELKKASDSLSELNTELEDRVKQRTAELQIEVNERKTVESKLFHMAFHDSLTALPNREWIIQRIEKLLLQCQNDKKLSFGVMFLDGDRFKQINDTHGHIFGDKLLVAASQRLVELMTDKQNVGRLGGDEFTVIAESYNEAELVVLANMIVESFKAPFLIDNNSVYFNVSIGILKCDSNYTVVPDVLRSADIAMYSAKESGKGTYKLFDQNMQNVTQEMAELEAGLRDAVSNNGFHLVYQPIVDLESGVITGFEALIRWNHPVKGFISPLTFIPIAEETGLIWEIGEWVLHEACLQTKRWHDMQPDILPSISVNLSTNQLQNANFLSMVDAVIKDVGIEAKYIKLELTESVLIENNHSMSSIFEGLRERKIDLAIDDFGTGYSSLAYLNEIPVQYLKIDRRFVEAIDLNSDAEINQDALEILKAMISLGKSLRKLITAEGIETETQLTALIQYGCDFAQGYFLSKPISDALATEILQSNKNLLDGGVNIPKEKYSLVYQARLDSSQ
ncbi:MAG: diguanylate cyclase (GGDEF)-like protein [Alphaproteobacteria bacterium]|jgi:diguanylate cyclase (GGDEF)-like protein